jgi:hypothetical protein
MLLLLYRQYGEGSPRRVVETAGIREGWGPAVRDQNGTGERKACRALARLAPARRCLPCPHKSEGRRHHRTLLRRRWVAPKSPWIFPWSTTLWAGSRCSTPTLGEDLLVSVFVLFIFYEVWESDVTVVQ